MADEGNDSKNIVLLSDGTGNSAAKANKTNVWRLYRALDLTNSDQVAFYDDGVGTQRLKYVRVAGGAFGIGLSKNVRDLYEFLCRNYDPDKTNHIYMFGFSRGAYTVRQLAGLVTKCGIIGKRARDGSTLTANRMRKVVRQFHRIYRRGYRTSLTKRLRDTEALSLRRDKAICELQDAYNCIPNPEIEFIGVWDTVDAVGLPFDSLVGLWNGMLYPFRFPDQNLSSRVKKACHAVAIDDERKTFHPVLWNEENEKEKEKDRIEQVWFAGVHSNVGGGYPDDTLAHVSLKWMIERLEAHDKKHRIQGLRLLPHERDKLLGRRDVHGKLYESRSGRSRYYRYKPRDIYALCHVKKPPEQRVIINNPKIHESVFQRIQDGANAYAPPGIPVKYKIVSDGNLASQSELRAKYNEDNKTMRRARVENTLAAWTVISQRKWLYRAFLAATGLVLLSPFYVERFAGTPPAGWDRAIAPVSKVAKDWIPNIANSVVDAVLHHPLWFAGFIISFAILYLLRSRLTRLTSEKCEAAWRHVINSPPTSPTGPNPSTTT